jgi:hypothetical protein
MMVRVCGLADVGVTEACDAQEERRKRKEERRRVMRFMFTFQDTSYELHVTAMDDEEQG